MRLRITGLLLVVLIAACTGQAATSGINEKESHQVVTADTFAQMSLCDPAWRQIYKQWILNGGGIKSSIIATRAQIASDRKSILARFIREVWNSPEDPRVEKNRLWHWPIDENKSRQAGWILMQAAKGHVPTECDTDIWLPAIVWDDIRFVNGDPGRFRMPSEAPTDVEWDGYTAPDWILYWLLVRIPQ